MNYYRVDGELHAYAAGGSQDAYIPAGAVLIPPHEIESHLSPPPSISDLTAYAADLRWRIETGGITVAGVQVSTDDRSKLMLSGARIAAMADPNYSTRWKTAAGWIDLSAVQIIAISDAVQAHVAACFTAEDQVSARIEAGELTTYAEIDAAMSGGDYEID